MLEKHLKTPYEKWVAKPFIERVLTPLEMTANKLTLLGVTFGIFCMIALSLKLTWISLIFLIVAGLVDSLDGPFARHQHDQTDFGSALDIFCDRIVEIAIIMGLYFYAISTQRGVLCLLMMGSLLLCVTSALIAGFFTRAHTTSLQNRGITARPGLIERTEMFIFFGLMILFPAHFLLFSFFFIVLASFTGFLHMMTLSPNRFIQWDILKERY